MQEQNHGNNARCFNILTQTTSSASDPRPTLQLVCVKPAIDIPILQLPTCWQLLFHLATQRSRYVYVLHPPTVGNTFCGHLAFDKSVGRRTADG